MNFLFSSSIESFLVVAGDAGVDGVGGEEKCWRVAAVGKGGSEIVDANTRHIVICITNSNIIISHSLLLLLLAITSAHATHSFQF